MPGNYKYRHQDNNFLEGWEEMRAGRVKQWASTLSVILYLKAKEF